MSLNDIWHDRLQGSREEFADFLGVKLSAIDAMTWVDVMQIAWDRFAMQATGGGLRFAGTGLQEYTYRIQLPAYPQHCKDGLPGRGSTIEARNELHRWFIGSGSTVDNAALSAVLVCWDLLYLRAIQSNANP